MAERSTGSIFAYIAVYATLLLLWGLNMGLSYIHMGSYLHNSVTVFIGLTQVSLVILFFMHLYYYHSKLVWFLIGAGFLWLGILMVLTMSDYITRTRPEGVNPKGEPVFLQPQRLAGAKVDGQE